MIDDKPIDYESEHNKAINKLVKLRQKYDELEEDRDYVKSLLDVEFEKRIKLQKENEQLRHDATILIQSNQDYRKENEYIKTTIKTMMENERTELGRSVLKQLYEAIQ